MKIMLLFAIIALSSCAQTTLYRNGQKIAAFQGDMTGVEYSDGDVRWKASTVDHSSATKASASRIQSAGIAVAASGLTTILK